MIKYFEADMMSTYELGNGDCINAENEVQSFVS